MIYQKKLSTLISLALLNEGYNSFQVSRITGLPNSTIRVHKKRNPEIQTNLRELKRFIDREFERVETKKELVKRLERIIEEIERINPPKITVYSRTELYSGEWIDDGTPKDLQYSSGVSASYAIQKDIAYATFITYFTSPNKKEVIVNIAENYFDEIIEIIKRPSDIEEKTKNGGRIIIRSNYLGKKPG